MAAAKFIKTEHLRNELLVVESNGQPEHFYLYQKQKHKGNTDYYQCRECFAQKRRRGHNEVRVPLIGVRDGTLTKEDTDGGHCENCRPCTNEYVVALSQKRNLYENMETGRKRAFQAHAEMLDNLPERCREEGASNAETITELPGYHQMSVSMWRHRKKGLPPIEDWTNLPLIAIDCTITALLHFFTIINIRGVRLLNSHTRSAAIPNFLTVGGLLKGAAVEMIPI